MQGALINKIVTGTGNIMHRKYSEMYTKCEQIADSNSEERSSKDEVGE